MQKKIINFNHLKRFWTSQPFFVWNSLDLIDQNLDHDLDLVNFDDLISFVDYNDQNLSQFKAQIYKLITKQFLKYLEKEYGSYVVVSKANSFEKRATITQEYFENKDVNYIYNPIWVYQYQDFQLVSNPIFYDKANQEVSFLKISTSTKRSDLIKMYFDVQVLLKLKVPVKKISLYILATKNYKRHQIDFFKTETININITFQSNNHQNYNELQLKKIGINKKKTLAFKKKPAFLTNKIYLLVTKRITTNFEKFDVYIDSIIESKKITNLQPLSSLDDSSIFGPCPFWKEVLKLKHDKKYHDWSGKVLRKEDLIKQIEFSKLKSRRLVMSKILDHKNPQIYNQEIVDNFVNAIENNLVLWYDFEAFTLPVAPLDLFLPFNQVVFQVSLIKTNNFKEIFKENQVFDPYYISFETLTKIVDVLYDPNVKYYVVYNASYENGRLKDIGKKLIEINHIRAQELNRKINHIINKTLDLARLFQINSPHKLPPILLPQLKGRYSIKLIEKYINQYYPDLSKEIVSYGSLVINNGLKAMEVGMQRAIGAIGINKWQIEVQNLKKYCQNDVKAMIMVYKLVKKINHL